MVGAQPDGLLSQKSCLYHDSQSVCYVQSDVESTLQRISSHKVRGVPHAILQTVCLLRDFITRSLF